MSKNLQKMKIDGERTRGDSCSSCKYVFKTEEIRNIENIDLNENLVFEEESDEETSLNIPKSEDNRNISAVFDALQNDPSSDKDIKVMSKSDKTTIKKSDDLQSPTVSQKSPTAKSHNSSQSSAIEIPLDYIKMAAKKSDDLKLQKLSQKSADDAKVPAAINRNIRKITKPSTAKLSIDTPNKPLRPIKNTTSVKRYFSSVEKNTGQNYSSNNPSKKSRNQFKFERQVPISIG